MQTRTVRSLLLDAGIAGPIVFTVVVLVLGFLAPGYDPIRDHVSLLLVSPVGPIQVANSVVSGMLLASFGLGLMTTHWVRRAAGMGASVVAAGVGLVIAGLFPTGMEHVGGAFLLFVGLSAACLAGALSAARARRLPWAAYGAVSGIVVFVLFRLAGSDDPGWVATAGLTQRGSMFTGLAYVLVQAIATRRERAASGAL